jgi:hypothetical protein
MATIIFNTSLISPLEWLKFSFFVAYVVSTIGVAVGVYWEDIKFSPEKQQRGKKLLILSLASDTLFTVLVFGTDGWIGTIQRREIIALEERLAWREFLPEQHDKVVSLIAQLPKKPTSQVVVDSVVGDPEAKRYGDLLTKALSDALNMPIEEPLGLSTCLQCTGVWICVNENATADTAQDGKIIRDVFDAVGVKGAQFCTDPRNSQGTSSTVKLIVGPKE